MEAQAIDKRTEFEKYHWEFAKTVIPKKAELKSIGETNSTVDMIGVFYRMPGEDSNSYKTFFTESGRTECEMKGIDWKEFSNAGREYYFEEGEQE